MCPNARGALAHSSTAGCSLIQRHTDRNVVGEGVLKNSKTDRIDLVPLPPGDWRLDEDRRVATRVP